jgi:glycosyltransferase involved in cell wall biosynthesis
MSSSESFGIVLLEAWLAGKPVIANVGCAAFHDMAVNEENALLVSLENLPAAIRRLLDDPMLARKLADSGKVTAERFDWGAVCGDFIEIVEELIASA